MLYTSKTDMDLPPHIIEEAKKVVPTNPIYCYNNKKKIQICPYCVGYVGDIHMQSCLLEEAIVFDLVKICDINTR